MNKNQIRKRYAKLLHEVKTNDYYKIDLTNRVNCYTCKCGHITKTKDIDPGVTPFLFECEKCGELAHSSFYNDISPLLKPTFEWYRPTLEELYKIRNEEHILNHIFKGGLNYRKCS